MILGYADKRTESFARGGSVPAFQGFREQPERRLTILESATSLEDLRGLPSNHLEVLRGDRRGQWSIRINRQWRICFSWPQDRPDRPKSRLSITMEASMSLPRPVRPGEVIAEELDEFGVSASELARQIGVPANRVSQILAGKRSVTGDTALRLGHWFGMSPAFWSNLQSLYELRCGEQAAGCEIAKLPRRPAA
jgi:antitoxin HigA-1